MMDPNQPAEEEYNRPDFRKWLDILQQESWQLELIISGFSLYALFNAFEPIGLEIKRAMAFENSVKVYLMTFLLASVFILILNLTAHVVLRGLWIGAIGLRYVSGDIDYDELKYTSKSKAFLIQKVGPYDRFIANLEKYCSVIFASAFLTVFYILALFIVFATLYWSNFLILWFEPGIFRRIIQFSLIFILGIGTLLTFIDFITLGGLKKNKILFLIYYPFYRLFSILTLSFIYRPIVYNLLDNRFGRRLAAIMIPVYVGIILLTSVRTVNSNYIPSEFEDTFMQLEQFETVASPLNYEDELGDDRFVRFISIPSKTITSSHLQIFLPFSERIEETMYDEFPELMPEEDQRGIMTSIVRFEERTLEERREMTMKYLEKFSEVYKLGIDSTAFPAKFVISQNSKGQSGFESVIPVKGLSDGKHILEYAYLKDGEKRILARVPFWYFGE